VTEVIVALDAPSAEDALELVDRLDTTADFYKVGLELFTREGPSVVRELQRRGKRVFLDLKLHDIPNTVAKAVEAAGALGVNLLTVHASGGSAMLEAARAAAAPGLRLLAVTVLTSLEADGLGQVWGRPVDSMPREVCRLGAIAKAVGIHGLVAAASDAARIRAELGGDVLLVVPGIRPAGVDRGDQARVATPAEAVRAGADYLVLGRAVTRAGNPVAALAAVLDEVAAART